MNKFPVAVFFICYILIKILLCICFHTHLGACLLCAKRDSVHLDQLGFYLFYHCSTNKIKQSFSIFLLSTNAARKYKGDKVLSEPLLVDWNARRKWYKSFFSLCFPLCENFFTEKKIENKWKLNFFTFFLLFFSCFSSPQTFWHINSFLHKTQKKKSFFVFILCCFQNTVENDLPNFQVFSKFVQTKLGYVFEV